MSAVAARLGLRRGTFQLAVELTLPERGVTALVGPAGAGKTTLLRCLAGLEPEAEGWVEVEGERWQDSSRRLFRPPHQRSLGLVFQDGRLFPHLSVRGNLDYGWRRLRAEQRRIEREEVIEWLRLAPLLERPVAGLSGGERQRVALGRALLASPRLLLLDEPLAALDAAGKAEILPSLEQLHRRLGVPVLYVSHSPEEILRVADRALFMAAGRLEGGGPLPEVGHQLAAAGADAAEGVGVGFEAVVAGHDEADRLTFLDFADGRLLLPRQDLPVGTPRRVRLLARDVSLSLARPQGSSILNVFPCRVVEVREAETPQPLVVLAVGGTTLLARVTRRAVRELGVAPGLELYAQVKAVALP